MKTHNIVFKADSGSSHRGLKQCYVDCPLATRIRKKMASTKEYYDYVLDQLSLLDGISSRK